MAPCQWTRAGVACAVCSVRFSVLPGRRVHVLPSPPSAAGAPRAWGKPRTDLRIVRTEPDVWSAARRHHEPHKAPVPWPDEPVGSLCSPSPARFCCRRPAFLSPCISTLIFALPLFPQVRRSDDCRDPAAPAWWCHRQLRAGRLCRGAVPAGVRSPGVLRQPSWRRASGARGAGRGPEWKAAAPPRATDAASTLSWISRGRNGSSTAACVESSHNIQLEYRV